MDPDELSVYCLAKPGVWLDNPFHEGHPVDEILEAIDESYRLVVTKMPRSHRPPG